MRSLQDLRPSGQARQGDELLKAAAELLEKHKDFTDKDNYAMAQGLLTSASDYRQGFEKKNAISRSQQSRLYLEKAHETLKTVKRVTEESAINAQDEDGDGDLSEREHPSSEAVPDSGAAFHHTMAPSMAALSFAPAATSLVPNTLTSGPTWRIAVDPLPPPPSTLASQIDNRSAQIRPSHKIPPVSMGWISEPNPSIDVTLAVSSLPIPTPPPTTTPPSGQIPPPSFKSSSDF